MTNFKQFFLWSRPSSLEHLLRKMVFVKQVIYLNEAPLKVRERARMTGGGDFQTNSRRGNMEIARLMKCIQKKVGYLGCTKRII